MWFEVYVDRMEDKNGEAVLSRERARREEAWTVLEQSFENRTRQRRYLWPR